MGHAEPFTPEITLVLGAGGARGVAHAAVLRSLRREGIAIDAILGCSVGAIVGGMYAAVGMEPDEMLEASRRLTAGSLLAFALSRWRVPGLSAAAGRRAGAIPEFLARLDAASFERLHHGVRRLGILTFDLVRREEVLALGGPGLPAILPLASAVKASAAIPVLFPPLRAEIAGRRRYLADAGWFTAVPVERAFAPPLSSRRVIAVDLSLLVCHARRAGPTGSGCRRAAAIGSWCSARRCVAAERSSRDPATPRGCPTRGKRAWTARSRSCAPGGAPRPFLPAAFLDSPGYAC